MKKWYLVKTKARQEELAVANLQNQNYIVYCPRSNINNTKVALFPGYLFIYLDEKTQNRSPINSTKGVLHFVKFGLIFARVPETVIEFIKSNQRITAEKLKNLNNFKSGDKVQITEGALKDYIAIFKCFKSDERVTLLLNLMGQEQTLSLQKKSVIAL